MSAQLTSIDVTAVYASTNASGGAKLGNLHTTPTGEVYQFVVAGGSFAVGDYVFITSDGAFTATQASTTNIASGKLALVGCYQGPTSVTSGQYCWVLRKGAHTGKFLASYVVGSKTYVTATAGQVDDTATTLIMGLTGLSTTVGAASISAYAATEMYASGQ